MTTLIYDWSKCQTLCSTPSNSHQTFSLQIHTTAEPQTIPATFAARGTISSNNRENKRRLFPHTIDFNVPENDQTLEILMLLKDILELSTLFGIKQKNPTKHWMSGIKEWWGLSFIFQSIHPNRHGDTFFFGFLFPWGYLELAETEIYYWHCPCHIICEHWWHQIQSDMIVSVGACSCLPDFRQIPYYRQWCFLFCILCSFSVICHRWQLTCSLIWLIWSKFPLAAYRIRGRTFVTLYFVLIGCKICMSNVMK